MKVFTLPGSQDKCQQRQTVRFNKPLPCPAAVTNQSVQLAIFPVHSILGILALLLF